MTQRPFIVVTDGLDKDLFQSLKNDQRLNVHPTSKVTLNELLTLAPQVEGLIIRSATTVNQELIDKMPKLKYVVRAGEGTDNIDKVYCRQKNIKVANTPGANNNSAAEHAIALMMTVLRKTAWANQSMHRGEWDKNSFTGNELANKTIGIVGFGRIGQIVAKRLSGFDPKVVFYDPFITSSSFDYARYTSSLEELFSVSDIITIHVPLLDTTKHLVSGKLLSLMKPSAILINAARGKIVDEQALFETLKNKKIRGAGFDVFEKEPLDPSSALIQLDNLVMTPHLGASTEEAQVRVGEMAVHQIQEFFINNNLLFEVKG